jgi:FkbM family methyltransferase
VAQWLARAAAAAPPVQHGLRAACLRPGLRRLLRVGAVAVAYPDVLASERLEVAEVDGYRLSVNLAEHQGAGAYFFGESVVPPWLPSLLRDGDACADVGANAGVFSLALAKACGPSGRVLAFEPNPALQARLATSLALNPGLSGRVEVDGRAVAEMDGARVRFYPSLDPRNSGTSSLLPGAHGTREDHALEVETVTLASALAARGLPGARFVKVDVEGAEARVLEGAASLLCTQGVALWFVELHRAGEAERRLSEAGYVGYGVKGASLVPLASVAPGAFGDFLFAAPEVVPEVESLGVLVRG